MPPLHTHLDSSTCATREGKRGPFMLEGHMSAWDRHPFPGAYLVQYTHYPMQP